MRPTSPCIEHGQRSLYGNTTYKGVCIGLHRLAYARANGLDPLTMGGEVMHMCDNPRCINATHLELGDRQSNEDDKVAKGRQSRMGNHGRAVLTLEIVRAIRAEYVKGSATQGMPALVRKYGVALATIRDVLNNTHWKE